MNVPRTAKAFDQLVVHEVVEESESGFFITKCDDMVPISTAETKEDGVVTCSRCLNRYQPQPKPLTMRARRKRGKPKNTTRESQKESLNFTHKAVITATEWFNRGPQFTESMLDQLTLAGRFIVELLAAHGRELPENDGQD